MVASSQAGKLDKGPGIVIGLKKQQKGKYENTRHNRTSKTFTI